MLAVASIPALGQAQVSAGNNGITIRTNDDNFTLHIGLDIQIDNRSFAGDSPQHAPPKDEILIRRARPTISGTAYQYVDFYIRPDFGQGTTILYDAYVELKYFPRAKLRAGKFKPPVGMERLQSDDDTNFIERGFPTLLAPSRDIGFQISGDLVKRRVAFAAGIFNGVPDNGLSDVSGSGRREFDGRIFLTPFLPNSKSRLSGLGFGIGASTGGVDGIPLPSYKTFGQASFFSFASGVSSAGHRTRLAPQAYYYLGPVGLLAEYTRAEEGFQKEALRRTIALRAWQIQAACLLTGEKKSFTTLTPRHDFDPRKHTWGAFELAVRTGEFSVEREFFDAGFASLATTPRHAREWAGGMNWYLNRSLRISADYAHTSFTGGAAAADGGNRPVEHALLQRFQINF
jgi:phosphate-selective porin OprO/OprP